MENDNELIYLIRENNEEATKILYDKYRPIINYESKKILPYIENKGIELSDIIQEAMIGFDEAIKNYNENENVLFYTFALLCIDRKLKTYIRTLNVNKNKILNESISFDLNDDDVNILNYIVKENTNPLYGVLENENVFELNNKIKDKLTILESKIFELKVSGTSNEEICKLLDIPIKTVYNSVHRIKDKLKSILK